MYPSNPVRMKKALVKGRAGDSEDRTPFRMPLHASKALHEQVSLKHPWRTWQAGRRRPHHSRDLGTAAT